MRQGFRPLIPAQYILRIVIAVLAFSSRRLTRDGLVIEDEMSLDAGIISAVFDASLEMVRGYYLWLLRLGFL